MYGLMRARHCGQSVEQSERHRFHYCGSCKTIGRLYGQRSRLLLNHDTVFLAELLTLLSAESALENADKSYQSYNCLSLPKSEDAMPRALRLAAAANVLLVEFKVADRIKDAGRNRWLIGWRLVRRFFSGSFRRAETLLRRMDFPVDELWRLQDRQDEREAARIPSGRNPAAALRRLATPTAAATAMFFSHGAREVGRPDLADTMRRLGYDFGRLIYLLDAFEDYKKDRRQGEFNALRAAFGWTTENLTVEQRRRVVETLLEIRCRIVSRISTLPIPASYATLYSERLDYNLTRRTGRSLPVLTSESQPCRKRSLSLAARWKNAVVFAKRMMRLEAGACSKGAWLKAHLAFISVLAVVFLVPSAASRLRSWQDCWSLGFNLMFLSALPGAVLAVVTPIPDPEANEKKEERDSFSCRECGRDCWEDCCGDCALESCFESCKCGCEECCKDCNCCDGGCDCCGCDC